MPVLLGFLRQEHGRPPRHRWGWGQFWHLQAGVWLCPGCWVKDWGLYHRLYWHSEPLNIGHLGVFRRENDGFLNFPTGGEAPLWFGWNQCRTSPILYIFQDQSFFCWQVWPPISSHFGNSRYTCLLSKVDAAHQSLLRKKENLLNLKSKLESESIKLVSKLKSTPTEVEAESFRKYLNEVLVSILHRGGEKVWFDWI